MHHPDFPWFTMCNSQNRNEFEVHQSLPGWNQLAFPHLYGPLTKPSFVDPSVPMGIDDYNVKRWQPDEKTWRDAATGREIGPDEVHKLLYLEGRLGPSLVTEATTHSLSSPQYPLFSPPFLTHSSHRLTNALVFSPRHPCPVSTGPLLTIHASPSSHQPCFTLFSPSMHHHPCPVSTGPFRTACTHCRLGIM